MPEGDAVRRLGVSLTDLFAGETLRVTSPQGRFASSAALLDGQVLQRVHVHGKHMFIGFTPHAQPDPATPSPLASAPVSSEAAAAGRGVDEDLQWVNIHLGLYGTWRFSADIDHPAKGQMIHEHMREEEEAAARPGPVQSHKGERWHFFGDRPGPWQAPEPVGQVRMRLETDYAIADLVGPNRCEIISDEERHQTLSKLGPDPLEPNARADKDAQRFFVDTVRSRGRAIGELMMDQHVIAGVGNIYRADILFLAGISPTRPGKRMSVARLEQLWELTCDVMTRGYHAGRLDTIDPNDAPAELIVGDEEASRWYVYHRTGRPCLRCGTPVAEKLMQNRRLFWCPSCQK